MSKNSKSNSNGRSDTKYIISGSGKYISEKEFLKHRNGDAMPKMPKSDNINIVDSAKKRK